MTDTLTSTPTTIDTANRLRPARRVAVIVEPTRTPSWCDGLADALGPAFTITDDRASVDLIVTDTTCPTELARLRAVAAFILVVATTAPLSPVAPLAAATLEAGADAFVCNPHVTEVAAMLRSLARRTRHST